MLSIYGETDIKRCKELWNQHIVLKQLTDHWDLRECFHQHFNNPAFFVVAQESSQIVGLIPLSFINEINGYGIFPGEVWNAGTWLEQNQIFAKDETVLKLMLDWLDKNKMHYFLRYLSYSEHLSSLIKQEDEIGYLFCPENMNFHMDNYYDLFSRKSIKSILREVSAMYTNNLVVREACIDDFDVMVRLNLERFGDSSYFADERFRKSFCSLRDWLDSRGWLRMTAIIINGEVAAVDMGAVYNGVYTLLAGGTHAEFSGVAKLINLYHMQQGCKFKYKTVDFLCGDFKWKTIFHLTPRPLYKLESLKERDPSSLFHVTQGVHADV